MEQEYKWACPSEASALAVLEDPEAASACTGRGQTEMEARYLDTPRRSLSAVRAGLRLRRENGVCICCVKRDVSQENGCTVREEYEVQADTVSAALPGLVKAGLPEDLAGMLAEEELAEICRVSFLRRTMALHAERQGAWCDMELALDRGVLEREGRSAPLLEAELEWKAGDRELFAAFAEGLRERCGLEPQPLSKLARAMAL